MKLKIPKFINQSFVILLAGLAIILIFVLIFIFPSSKDIKKLDSEIKNTKTKIEVQEQLGPAYRQLTEKLKLIDEKAILITPKPIGKNQLGYIECYINGIGSKFTNDFGSSVS